MGNEFRFCFQHDQKENNLRIDPAFLLFTITSITTKLCLLLRSPLLPALLHRTACSLPLRKYASHLGHLESFNLTPAL